MEGVSGSVEYVAMTTVAHFEIPYSRFLDPGGTVVEELPAFARDPELLRELVR